MRGLGFLFDLDGTLIDSLPVVELAWGNWARRHGVPEAEVLNFIHGKQAITSLRHFMPGQSEETIQHEYRLLERFEAETIEGVSALPGARALLTELNRLQLPWAIVTSGSLPVASARVRAGQLPAPPVLITAEQVPRGKPQPDPYLLGAEKLGFRPADCIVVEDAIANRLKNDYSRSPDMWQRSIAGCYQNNVAWLYRRHSVRAGGGVSGDCRESAAGNAAERRGRNHCRFAATAQGDPGRGLRPGESS